MAQELTQRFLSQAALVASYRHPANVSAARRTTLTPQVEEDLEIQATIKISENPSIDLRDALAVALLNWFKNLFKWFKPPEGFTPAGQSIQNGNRVEIYKKGTETFNFIRYNDPVKLIDPSHRTGRCGEFANAFAFLASVMGFEVRKVSTVYEDHIWVELYSEAQKRWIHYDPCENQHDMPLVYELGWKKELSYVVAVQADLVSDVSKKYSVQHQKLALNQATKAVRYDEYIGIYLKKMLLIIIPGLPKTVDRNCIWGMVRKVTW